MNKLFSFSLSSQNAALAVVRILLGLFTVYHGWEIFNATKMNDYQQWDIFKNLSTGKLLPYIGKAAELVAGVLLLMGLFTRSASLFLIVTMSYIAFFIGHGKIWYEDQHPFMFVLLGIVFLFTGGGRWSADYYLFKQKSLYN